MKRVSLRNFQLKPSLYINELPIILTTYNKDIAQIIPLNYDPSTESTTPTTIISPEPVILPSVAPQWEKRCEAPGINCINFGKKYNITFTQDGEKKQITSFLCNSHAAQAMVQADTVEETV